MLARLNWRPQLPEIRYFANTLAVLGIVFAIILAMTGKLIPGFTVAGACIALATVCRSVPTVGRWVYIVWMLVAFALSLIISPLVIAIIYFVFLTPISLFARLTGKDELRLKRQTGKSTNFEDADYSSSPDTFRRQF